MWSSGVHINCFFEWWKTKEYNINFESEDIRQSFLKDIESKNDWIYQRLKWLKNDIKLKDTQLYWYFKKYQNYIDKDLIKQEYPCTPNEAFLMSGNCIFDVELIINRLSRIPRVIKQGYFVYDEEKARLGIMTNIKWVNDRNGYIKIYELPNTPKVTRYCIGGDTAGEGSDYFTGHVLDARTGKQVAVLKHQFDADLYAKQMYCLGMYYSSRNIRGELQTALIGIECNFDSFPIRELERLGYYNMYVRQEEDTYTGKLTKRFGFRTDRNSRPRVISNLVQVVRESTNLLNDKDTLEEMLTFVRNEKGRPEAQEGAHDDLVMGLAIAYEIKDQVLFSEEPITMEQQFNFSVEKPAQSDYGETIIPV